MIINDEHQFVFVHIPKCAGSFVRDHIKPFDSRKGIYQKISHHLALGALDFSHIPLFVLREHFPQEFERLQNYSSFAVVRNPFDRFASSLSQHLLKSSRPISTRSTKEIQCLIHETIDYLSRKQKMRYLLSAEYIHFQRQVDYIEDDGERIIENIYTIGQINELLSDVESKVGRRLVRTSGYASKTMENQSVVFRNDFIRWMYNILRPKIIVLYRRLPKGIKRKISEYIYVSRDERLRDIFQEDHIKDFIRDYYSEDISLYQHILKTADLEAL